MNNMRTQIQQTVSALYTLLQRLQEVQRQAQATIAACAAAAQAQAAAALGGGGGAGGGGGGGGTGGGSGNTTTGNNGTTYKVGFVSEDGSMGQQTYTFKDRQSANNFLREVDKTNDMA